MGAETCVSFPLSMYNAVIVQYKQECIPVWCVPPTRYRTGVSMTETTLDRDPWTETPSTENLLWTETPQRPLDRDPLDRDPPGQRTHLGQRPLRDPLDRNHLDRDPHGQRFPQIETPSPGQRSPQTETFLDREPLTENLLNRDPSPGQRPPWIETPLDRDRGPSCGQIDTSENITFANFICGQ